MNSNTNGHKAQGTALRQIGWKSYNTIKKKAMEQEFSWSGLSISLSIAFFVAFSSSYSLNLAYKSIASKINTNAEPTQRVYFLEHSAKPHSANPINIV